MGRGNLLFSNCSTDTISRLAADGAFTMQWMKGSESAGEAPYHKTNGITVFRDGSSLSATTGATPSSALTRRRRGDVCASQCGGKPLKGPNDLAFDPKGNLYFTDPAGSGATTRSGALYRVEAAARKVTRVAEGWPSRTALAFTADAKHLYVCESQQNRIVRFAVKPDGFAGPDGAIRRPSPRTARVSRTEWPWT